MKRFLAVLLLIGVCASCLALNAAAGNEIDAELILTQENGVCTVSVTADAPIGSVQFTLPEEAAASAEILTEGFSAAARSDDTFAYIQISSVNHTFIAAGTADGIPADTETALLSFRAEEPVDETVLSGVEIGGLDGVTRFSCEIVLAAPVLPGDADGNGTVDQADAILIRKYLAGWKVEIDLKAADMSGDGKVTARDSLLLRQYLAARSGSSGR